jgi:hypothetical protein
MMEVTFIAKRYDMTCRLVVELEGLSRWGRRRRRADNDGGGKCAVLDEYEDVDWMMR